MFEDGSLHVNCISKPAVPLEINDVKIPAAEPLVIGKRQLQPVEWPCAILLPALVEIEIIHTAFTRAMRQAYLRTAGRRMPQRAVFTFHHHQHHDVENAHFRAVVRIAMNEIFMMVANAYDSPADPHLPMPPKSAGCSRFGVDYFIEPSLEEGIPGIDRYFCYEDVINVQFSPGWLKVPQTRASGIYRLTEELEPKRFALVMHGFDPEIIDQMLQTAAASDSAVVIGTALREYLDSVTDVMHVRQHHTTFRPNSELPPLLYPHTDRELTAVDVAIEAWFRISRGDIEIAKAWIPHLPRHINPPK